MVFKIARAELRTLFYSPVAWFLTIAFLVVCACFYTGALSPYANWQELYLKSDPKFVWPKLGFTRELFFGADSIFRQVLQNLYLFIPLLTMGLIGREINTGSIKLLFSSPIRLRDIVMGKYLAIMIFNLLLVGIVGIFMVTGYFNIRAADYGMLWSAALGFYLLTCAYTAIGLFMSSLSTYPIVSAIATFIVIFILSHIGGLWQRYDFIRDLTYFLFISGRAEKMLLGLITTKDVIYFVLVVYMFLGFTLIKLRSGRESRRRLVQIRRYGIVVISTLLLGYISSRPLLTGYWDTTAQKVNTIHERTQQLIKDLGTEPLEVTLYVNMLGGSSGWGYPEARNTYLSVMWEQYQRFKPDIQFKYVYYYDYDSTIQGNDLFKGFPGKTVDQIAEKIAGYGDISLSSFKKPAEIRRLIDLKPEGLRLVMQLGYKGKKEFLRTFNDSQCWPDEEHVAAVLKRLRQPVLPKAVFITGDLERNIYKRGEREYQFHTTGKDQRVSLINRGFDVDTLSLDNRDIPADISFLVLADPKTALSPVSLEKISHYLARGGNMWILGEPGKQSIVNPVLRQLGVQLMDGTLVMPSYHEMPHVLEMHVANPALSIIEYPSRADFKKVPDKDEPFRMIGAAALSHSDSAGYTVKSLLNMFDDYTWLKAGRLVSDSAAVTYMPEEGDRKGSFHPLIALTKPVGNKVQRIIVSGDADFMSNLREGIGFGIYVYAWLDEGVFPVFLPRPQPVDNLLTIGFKAEETMETIYIWVLPGLVLLMGTVLLIRRKRK